MMRGLLSAATLVLAVAAAPATAHQLVVFASVNEGVVEIEATFSNGKPVVNGTLRIRDADDTLIHEEVLSAVRPIQFLVGEHLDGLRIEVDAGGGHSNYWLLTPADLAP
ncbi:MAG: hypothetical protein ACK46Q_00660 [Hyphomonas sp.]